MLERQAHRVPRPSLGHRPEPHHVQARICGGRGPDQGLRREVAPTTRGRLECARYGRLGGAVHGYPLFLYPFLIFFILHPYYYDYRFVYRSTK